MITKSIRKVQTVIIGSGFGGLAAARELALRGLKDFLILERSGGIGGVWHNTQYPGLACDIPSFLYSYSYFQNPNWSRHFAPGPEIKKYLEAFTDYLGIRDHVLLNSEVKIAKFDTQTSLWNLKMANGENIQCNFLIAATGQQHTPKYPSYQGQEKFKGIATHSARWDQRLTNEFLKGKRIGLIGTGASAVQIVIALASIAGELKVFQRSPVWILPRPDREITSDEQTAYANNAETQIRRRQEQRDFYDGLYDAILPESPLNEYAKNLCLKHMESQIPTQELRDKLIPKYPWGVKRVVSTNDYLPCFLRDNVKLITEPLAKIEERGVVDHTNRLHELDVLIYATGYDSTNYLGTFEIVGSSGQSLRELWADADAAEAFLGTFVHGFPNFFVVHGPNSGPVLSSVVLMIEPAAELIAKCIQHSMVRKWDWIDVKQDVQQVYNDEIQKALVNTVYQTEGVTSWYKTASGKVTTRWPFSTEEFERRLKALDLSWFNVGHIGQKKDVKKAS